MKISKMKDQLEEIKNAVNEVLNLIKDDNYFTESKSFLNKSSNELEIDNIQGCLDFINRAKQSAIKEKEVWVKLKETQNLIRKKLTGSNPKEANNCQKLSLESLKQGEVDKAFNLADKAMIASQPPPEYLLQNARSSYSEGLKKYEKEKFEESIKIWKQGIEEYERARKIAEEKKDQNMIKNIEEAVNKLIDLIKDAEVAFDNRKMVKFDEEADKKINSIEQLIQNHLYDEAISTLNEAKKDTENALQLAKKNKFNEDLEKIEKRKDNIEKRIGFYQLEKGKYLLENSISQISKSPNKSEKELYDFLDYFEKLNIKSEASKQLIERCKKAIIDSKIAQAQKTMKDAEGLYKNEKFYDAREIYEKTQDYLGKVEDEAGKFQAKNTIDEIRKLRRICTENRDSCNSQLFNLPDAPKRKLIRTKDTHDFIIPVNEVQTLYPGDEDKLKKLSREYDVLNYIGGGGFADVYKAKWKTNNMTVALKVPRELTSTGEDTFFKEIRNWEKLKHRNIVKLIKPRINPTPHLVIEYIDGTTLDNSLQSQKIKIDDACRIAYDMARGLECAHSKNIIHLDLKPKNILISNVGEAKITDFGIAKTIIATTTGLGGRTLIYSAPEQLEGHADYTTDIYQLGLVLYQMITGRNPFDIGSFIEIEKSIKEDVPEPPSTYNNDAKPLDDIVMRCLLKNSDERPSITHIKQILYEYMKKYHGESLHLTSDNKSYVKILIRYAFMAAKQADISECISCLKSAEKKTGNKNFRNKLGNVVKQLETIKEEKIGIKNETIDKIEDLFREVI